MKPTPYRIYSAEELSSLPDDHFMPKDPVDRLAYEIAELLNCLTVYGPEYMHGEPKWSHVKRARKILKYAGYDERGKRLSG